MGDYGYRRESIMKILYISEATLPSMSAQSVAIMNMCCGMSQAGHEVILIAIRGENECDIWKYYSLDKFPHFRIIYVKKNGISRLVKIKILLIALIHMKNVDLVYTRWNYGAYLANKIRKKTIIEYHSKEQSKRQRKIVQKVVASRYTCKVVCITQYLKELYSEETGHREKYFVESGASQIINKRKEIFVPHCGYIGSFYEGKGIEVVLQIAKEMEEMQFHIIGGKSDEIKKLQLKYEVGDNVIWYGYQPYEKALELMDKFSIALLPNQEQVLVGGRDIGKCTSPNKMFEYLAYGKVIIASDLPVLQEVLENGVNAILVDEKNIRAWKNAIQNVIKNKSMAMELGRNAVKCIETTYNWKSRAERILDDVSVEKMPPFATNKKEK